MSEGQDFGLNDEATPLPDLWPTAAPPAGFIDTVMAARAAEIGARAVPDPTRRRRRAMVAVTAAAAVITMVTVGWPLLRGRAPASGTLQVATRTSVDLGRRARAVLEPGAALGYEVAGGGAAHVRQDRGSVFYRVEPGGPFRVSTAAGEIEVVGTCFRVIAGPAAERTVIAVLEGAVKVRNQHGHLQLAAGETAVLRDDEAPRMSAPTDGDPGAPPSGAPQPAPPPPAVPTRARHDDVPPGHPVRGGRVNRSSRDAPKITDGGQGGDGDDVGDHWAPAPPPWPAPKPRPLAIDGGPVIRLRFDERGAAPLAPEDAVIQDAPLALADYAQTLRDRVVRDWHPLAAIREELALDDVGAGAARRTLVRVRIDRSGRLLRSDIDEPSGLPSLDGEARRALQISRFPPPPSDLLDDFGELGVRFEFHLDLAVSAFLARVRRDVAERWHPALPFQRFARPEQITVVRVSIAPAGVIAQSRLDVSSGISHLDDSALAATSPGTRVPAPPAVLCPAGAPVALRLEFVPDVSGHGTIRIAREPAPPR
jgi:hypothetical protein